MIYDSRTIEEQAVLHTAQRICAAARTAPKGKGLDNLETLVLTGADKDAVAEQMEALAGPLNYKFFLLDAQNVRAAQALVLLGLRESKRGLNDGCGYCHFENCAECAEKNGVCAFDAVDIGIAIGSAVAAAADDRVDSRVYFSVGRAALQMKIMGTGVSMIFGILISVSGKSPFFDRK